MTLARWEAKQIPTEKKKHRKWDQDKAIKNLTTIKIRIMGLFIVLCVCMSVDKMTLKIVAWRKKV